MGQINKQTAETIVKKLKGVLRKNTQAHDLYEIYSNDGILITQIGIRRGSNKDQGHGHIPNQLHISFHDTKLMGACFIQKNDWIGMLKDKNIL